MKNFIKIIILLTLIILTSFGKVASNEKIKIGLLVPLTGKNSEIGQSIIKSTRLAINKINNPFIEIIPRDTASDPNLTLRSAKELQDLGVKIIIGNQKTTLIDSCVLKNGMRQLKNQQYSIHYIIGGIST